MKGNQSNGFLPIIAQAIAEMEEIFGKFSSIEDINLAELSRRTSLSRSKLRCLKANGFRDTPHGLVGQRREQILDGYTAVLDSLLRSGVSNSSVCMERLQSMGFQGSLSTVKRYIAAHKNLIPAKRQQIAPQGNRGRRYTTSPGEAYQMDWGFTDVLDYNNYTFRVACFAMICHHCGQRYIEFFPNARQENLFIGMIHAFQYMGIPRFVLTDNMKSVVLRRDMDGHPIWQKDYENFMKTVGFETKLCKPRHPFTKGKVERLVRFVKDNFLVDRVFSNITDLNWQALDWCNHQNNLYHRATASVPQQVHMTNCVVQLHELPKTDAIRFYLCPERKISFDGFVNYEGRRFGVPYSYSGKTARISRSGDTLYIYSADLRLLLVTHNVTWSRKDSFCEGQYEDLPQPEEFPTMPVKTQILRLPKSQSNLSFAKFDFDEEDSV